VVARQIIQKPPGMHWRYRGTLLTLCTLAFFVTMVGRLVISPVVPLIIDDFDISNTVIGIALTGMWMSYSASQFPSGVLADRFGERVIILVAIGGTGIVSLVIAVAPIFPLFIIGTTALGIVAGLHYTVATALLTRTYDEMGIAIGVHNIGAPAAGLLIPPVGAWIGARYGWRSAILLVAAVAVPTFVLFACQVRPTKPRRPNQPMRGRFTLESIVELLTRPQIAFPTIISVLATFVWQGTASFLPTFLVAYRGQSLELAGTVFASYFIVQAVMQVGVGWVSDLYGRDRAIAGCMILGTTGYVLLIAVPGWVSLSAAILLVGTGMGFGAALSPRFLDVLSEEEQGTGFGLVRSVYGLFGALGSVLVGLMADLFGWASAIALLAVLLLIVFCALLLNQLLSLGY